MQQVEKERRFSLAHHVLHQTLRSPREVFLASSAGEGRKAAANVKMALDKAGIIFSSTVDGLSEFGGPAEDPACVITVCVEEKDFSRAVEVNPYSIPNRQQGL